jgi:hypothetical protein
VAEHSLGKGEVGSSILPMGTRDFVEVLSFNLDLMGKNHGKEQI